MANLLIKNGTLITSAQTILSDLRIEGEKIVEIGPNLSPRAGETVLDATNKYIFPGGVDVHTHLSLPVAGTKSADDFLTGTRAALCGGTTTFLDFVGPDKGQSLLEALKLRHKEADGQAVCDYGFHMVVNDLNDSIKKEIPQVVQKGITSFKCFMAYKGRLQISDEAITCLLNTVGSLGGLVMLHAEDGDRIDALIKQFLRDGKTTPEFHLRSRPPETEVDAVKRALFLAEKTGQPLYVVHVSHHETVALIAAARKKGVKVFTETCPQYLLLDDSKYLLPGFEAAKFVLSPPLRSAGNLKKMWDDLKQGYIQTVATDHCPFNFHGQKDVVKNNFSKIPNGIGSIGDRLNLLYTYGVAHGHISLHQFVDLVATTPAKIFGMYPQKGSLVVGGDADIVVFDPKSKSKITAATQKHNVDYSAFEGFELAGQPTDVLLRGKFAVRSGQYVGEQGFGKFVSRKVSGKIP